jgi:hypothetical protein
MMNLPLEIQPEPALEARVVSTLVVAGLVRPRRAWPMWSAAAAAVILLAFAAPVFFRPNPHTQAKGQAYVVLLYEDSTYRPTPPGHQAERVAVVARWADSLDAVGKLDRAGRVRGPGELGGLFIIRAADDADAAQIAAACPFTKWGGHIEVRRFDP